MMPVVPKPNRPDRLAVEYFSTETLALAQRYEAWRQRGWPNIAPIYESTPIGDFGTTSERFQLGNLSLSYAGISSQIYHRSAERLRGDNIDHLSVSVMFEGVAEGVAGDRQFVAGPGAILLTDMARQSLHQSTASQSALFTLPRGVAEALLGNVEALHGTVIRPDSAALLVSHLLRMRSILGSATAAQGLMLGNTLLDLLAYSVSVAQVGVSLAPARQDATLLLRASDLIEARLGSPSLGIADLCRRLNISRSALYRLFVGQGGVQAYIRTRRLERVKLALADPQGNARIGDLAEFWGFSDAAHLSRLFRAAYGTSPRDFRASGSSS